MRRTLLSHAARCRQRGLSLIELMVGLVIALVISLVMFNVFIVSEGQRRTTASGSDAQQAGTIASYTLERYMRMGGAGIGRLGFEHNLWGCRLLATSQQPTANTVRLPLPGLPEPFDTLGISDVRATPALIVNGGTPDNDDAQSPASDMLMVMAGMHRSVDTWIQAAGIAGTDKTPVQNSVGLQPNDVLLALEQDSAAPSFGDCQMAQSTSQIELALTAKNYRQSTEDLGKTILISGGAYTPSNGLVPPNGAYTSLMLMADLGDTPLFALFGVAPSSGMDGGLRMYNMLTAEMRSIGDGIVNIQAVYGVSSEPRVDAVSAWQAPVGDWRADKLMDGSDASRARLGSIRALRISMVARSALLERDDVSEITRVLPGDADFAYDIAWAGTERKYRYRQFELVVPLRNMLFAAATP